MKTIAQPALDALDRGDAVVAGAVEIMTSDPIRVWSGNWPIELGGETYQPLGHREIAISASGATGGVAQNLNLVLSGIEPEVLRLLDAMELRSAPVTVQSLIFDSSATNLLAQFVHRRGRVDRVLVKEQSGGTATITVQVESPARGLGRRTGRVRSDADQRLIKAIDGAFRLISFVAEKVLYWGGPRPSTAGSAVGGGGPGPAFNPDSRNLDFR